MSKKRRARRRPTEAERAERRAQERRLMAEAVGQLSSSEGWRRWLRVRRHFHCYSLHNQLLIALQMPEATRVAGFAAWLKLGYAVRKGETGIWIWAPCRPSKKKVREWRAAGADPATEPRVFFRMVKVFDRSQVGPLPDFPGGPVALDRPIAPLAGDGLAPLFDPLRDLAASIGVSVVIGGVPAGAGGCYRPDTKAIGLQPISTEISPNQLVKTLIHEPTPWSASTAATTIRT
jgi:antirestriction protein ArdC